jgi:hypothetical protein
VRHISRSFETGPVAPKMISPPCYRRGDWTWARGNHGSELALVEDVELGGDRVVLCFENGDRIIRSISEVREDEARYPL